MRFSATDRIIRDAERQDDGVSSRRNRDAIEALPDIDIDLGGTDSDDDDEGKTLVDEARAATALQELRSYGVPSARKSSQDGVPTALASASRTSAVVAPGLTPAKPPLRWAGGVPPGRPASLISAQPTAESHEHRPELDALLVPEAPFEAIRLRPAVGRRQGILIAAVTAAAVALVLGTWTARSVQPIAATIIRASPSVAPRTPVSPVVVQTALQVVSGSAQSLAEAPQPPTAVPPSPGGSKPHLSRKLTPIKTRPRGSHATKGGNNHSRPHRVIEIASPPKVHIPDVRRLGVDPDATLPITDQARDR